MSRASTVRPMRAPVIVWFIAASPPPVWQVTLKPVNLEARAEALTIFSSMVERSELFAFDFTNTGYYGGAGDKFVPKHAYVETVDQLADRWVREWKDGIEDSGVRPGFIKIGIDEIKGETSDLSTIDEKIVRASARASKLTGLSVTCHTGGGLAGLKAVKLFIEEKAPAHRFIVAHSDSHGLPINRQVAELGSWVSFDAISRQPVEQHLALSRP